MMSEELKNKDEAAIEPAAAAAETPAKKDKKTQINELIELGKNKGKLTTRKSWMRWRIWILTRSRWTSCTIPWRARISR